MENNKYSYCNIAELTHVGMKRKANEDWMGSFECQNGLVAVVCDGMGGHVGGAVASHTAVEAIEFFLKNNYIEDPRVAIGQAIEYANQAILSRVAQQPELNGMGATCVMLIIRDGKVYVGSVGDSRIYYISGHVIRQLTKDQSFVQLLVDRGELTPEQAERHPRKNEILNALGLPNMTPAVVLPDAISPTAGDCILLCSDGLSGMVDDKQICKIVTDRSMLNQQQRVEKLIATANANGGLDNITAQLVEFAVTPGAEKKGITVPSMKKMVAGVVALLVMALVLGVGYRFMSDDVEKKEEVAKVEQVENEQALNESTIEQYEFPPIEFKAKRKIAELRAGKNEGITEFVFSINGNEFEIEQFDIDFNKDSIEVKSKADIFKKQVKGDALVLRFLDKIEHLDTITCTLKSENYTQIIKIPVSFTLQKTSNKTSTKERDRTLMNGSGDVSSSKPNPNSKEAPIAPITSTNQPSEISSVKAESDSTILKSEYTFECKFVADSTAFKAKIEGNANAVSIDGNTLILPGRYRFTTKNMSADCNPELVNKTKNSLIVKFPKEKQENCKLEFKLILIDRAKDRAQTNDTVRTTIKVKYTKD